MVNAMLRSLLLPFICSAAIAPSPAHQVLSNKVSYKANACRAKTLVGGLAAATGLDLQVSKEIEPDVLLVSVQDVPVQELLDQIAKADHAIWKHDKDTYTLTRPESTRIADEARDHKLRVEAWNADLEAYLKPLRDHAGDSKDAAAKDSTPAAERMQMNVVDQVVATVNLAKAHPNRPAPPIDTLALIANDPDEKVQSQLILAINPNDAADARPGQRLVFATDPNEMQRPLGQGAYSALQTIAALREKLVYDLAAKGVDVSSTNAGATTTEVAKVIVVMSGSRGRGGMSILYLDSAGRQLGAAGSSFGGRWGRGPSMDGVPPNVPGDGSPDVPPKKPAGPKESNIRLSDLTKEVCRHIGFQYGGGRNDGGMSDPPPPSRECKQFLAHLDVQDPLSLLPSEFLFDLAERKQANLVAVVPDSLIQLFDICGGDSEPQPTPLMELAKTCGVEFESDGGWIRVVPSRPSEARLEREDRLWLAKAAREALSGHESNLEELALLTTGYNPLSSHMVSSLITSLCDPYGDYSNVFAPDDSLIFYSTLSALDRTALAAGRPISVGVMTQGQQAALTNTVFYSENAHLSTSPDSSPLPPPTNLNLPEPELIKLAFNRNAPDVPPDPYACDEPTQLMPTGLLRSSRYSMSTRERTTAVAQFEGTKYTTTMDPQDLANQRRTEKLSTGADRGQMRATGYILARNVDYDFKLQATRRLTYYDSVEITLKVGKDVVGLEGLPDSFRADVLQWEKVLDRLDVGRPDHRRDSGGGIPPFRP